MSALESRLRELGLALPPPKLPFGAAAQLDPVLRLSP